VIGAAKSLTRMFGLIVKELRDLARRPSAILSLVLGPLLIMALFGIGYEGNRNAFDTVVVLPSGSPLPHDVAFYQKTPTPGVNVIGVTEDAAAAEARLARREIRLVVVVPSDYEAKFRGGQQATVTVLWNEIDPIEDNVAKVSTQMMLQELNRQIIEAAAGEGLRLANVPDKVIPPQVIAQPLKADTQNRAPVPPSVLSFFAPAVFALVLQHLGITLTALALVRERLSGAMDLFRVAPLRPWEVLAGKYVAYGLLSLIVAVAIVLLMTRVFAVPLLGAPDRLAMSVAFLAFASLGAGLFISLVADSERQAVQLAMLLLLVSVFFSGFVLPVDEFRPVARAVSYVLPVTYGIQLFPDVMLRGAPGDPSAFTGLVAIGLALYFIDLIGLRRVMRRAA